MKKGGLGFIVFVLLAGWILTACQSTNSEKRISVVFRYDDYSQISNSRLEEQIIQIFRERGMSFTVAVIPFVFSGKQEMASIQSDAANVPLGPDRAAILKSAMDAGVVDVALHGYSHQTIPFEEGHTEFNGLKFDVQLRRIADGKKFLEQQLNYSINTFVPPWDRYDLNSLKVLEQLGFKTLSANQDGLANPNSTLKFLPDMINLNQLLSAVAEARYSLDPHPVIVVLFHQFEVVAKPRSTGGLTLDELTHQLDWLSAQKDVGVMSVRQLMNQRTDLDARRYQDHQSWLHTHLIPPFLKGLIHPLVYESPYPNFFVLAIFYLAVLFISLAAAFCLGRWIFPRSKTILQISRPGILVLLFLVSAYALRGRMVGYKGAIGTMMFCGAAIGVWWSSFLIGKKAKRIIPQKNKTH